jgi:NodT family efflux transporter outer membrane factor (OMF) lipoprotein
MVQKKIFNGTWFRQLRLWLPVAFITWTLAGCMTVGPDYAAPDMRTADSWQKKVDGASNTPAEGGMLANWWSTLDDPVLNTLMEQAVSENLDLQSALSAVRQARISRGIAEAGRYPGVDANGSARRTYQNDAAGDFRGADAFGLGLDASWEIDIFGGVRRSIEASDAELAATVESYRDVLVSLLAEVAMNYVELRSYQARLQVAEANLKSQEETWDITRWRHEAGLTTALDVELAKTNMEQTRAEIPSLLSGIDRTLNIISALVGKAPDALDRQLGPHQPIPLPPETIAVGIPADLLRRRPDLRRAERDLAAQTARIGVAKSKLYPSFSLSGSVGLDALRAGDLVDDDSFSTGIGGLVSWPVYKAGAIIRDVELQWEIREQKLIVYRKALLEALRDVENGLISYASEKERRESLLAAYQSAALAVEMSRVQYTSGLEDFTTVLDSERTLLSIQNQLALSDAQIIKNLIALYKALGGGWESDARETGAGTAG